MKDMKRMSDLEISMVKALLSDKIYDIIKKDVEEATVGSSVDGLLLLYEAINLEINSRKTLKYEKHVQDMQQQEGDTSV